MNRTHLRSVLCVVLSCCAGAALASDPRRALRADLEGAHEIPANSTQGRGTFRAHIAEDDSAIEFVLTYSRLSGPARVAHVHIGQFFANGAVSFFLCGGSTKPPCPPDTSSGPVRGTIKAVDVIGPAAQGIAPGDLAAVLSMMRRGLTYANIHTERFPNGEIRGQVGARKNERDLEDEDEGEE